MISLLDGDMISSTCFAFVWPVMGYFPSRPTCCLFCLQQQQLQAQHLSHAAHGPPVQLPPHPSGLQPPGLPPVTGAGSGLLALGALGSQAHLPVKDEKNHHDLEHRGEEPCKSLNLHAGLTFNQTSITAFRVTLELVCNTLATLEALAYSRYLELPT